MLSGMKQEIKVHFVSFQLMVHGATRTMDMYKLPIYQTGSQGQRYQTHSSRGVSLQLTLLYLSFKFVEVWIWGGGGKLWSLKASAPMKVLSEKSQRQVQECIEQNPCKPEASNLQQISLGCLCIRATSCVCVCTHTHIRACILNRAQLVTEANR